MATPTKKRTPRKTTQIKKTEEPTPIALMVESAPIIPKVEEVVEVVQPEPEIATPAARRWYVIRYLPENVGTAEENEKAWQKEVAEMGKMTKDAEVNGYTTSRKVNGVNVRYIVGQEELLDYLVANHPGYIQGCCPEYQVEQV